jgi:hypothetical protein
VFRFQPALILVVMLAVTGVALGAELWRARLADIAAHPDVRREIGLTLEQGRELDEVIKRLNQDAAPDPQTRSEITKLLKSDQVKRLEQIHLQVLNGFALEAPEIVKTLGLNDSQRKRLDEAIKNNAAEERTMLEVMKRSRFATAEARRRFVAKYRDAASGRLLNILTEEQKTQFQAMKGKPFSEADRLHLPAT